MSGGRVAVRYSKWGGADHWHFEVEPLGQDQFGSWFFARQGLTQQRGAEPRPPAARLRAARPGRGLLDRVLQRRGELEIYVDVTTRPVLDGGTVAVDLDLDVVRYFDGRVEILDEDEFAEHQAQLAYPAELISQARRTCDWLVGACPGPSRSAWPGRPGWPGPAREPPPRLPAAAPARPPAAAVTKVAGTRGGRMSVTPDPAHLSNHHRNTLRQIFEHPVSHNIEWRAVVSLLEAVGTTVEQPGGKLDVTIGTQKEFIEPPAGKDLDTQTVLDLRRMLSSAGYQPDGGPA